LSPRTPRYLELAAELRQAIALGETGPGGILDSEAALGSRFAVSRVTVRKALAVLEREGLVSSRQGAGWFATVPVENALGLFPTEVLAHEAAGGSIERRAIDSGWIVPPAAIRTTLGLRSGTRAFRFRRINYADGLPYDLVTTWLPARVGRKTSHEELERIGSWAVMRRLDLVPTRTEQTITSALATTAEARLLEREPPLALLLLRRIGYLADGRAIAMSDHRYPGTRIRLSVSFSGVQPVEAEPPGRELVAQGRRRLGVRQS
jgi:GntR family transcriptional regulator